MLGILFALIAALSQSVIAVASRVLKRANFSSIMFHYGFVQALIQGVILVGIYLWTGNHPFIYNSWRIYGKILFAVIANISGLSMILVA